MTRRNYWLTCAIISLMPVSMVHYVHAATDSAGPAAQPVPQSVAPVAHDGYTSGASAWEVPEGMVVRPHMYGHLVAGQIENGSLVNFIDKINGADMSKFKIDHVWTEDADIELGLEARYRDYFKMVSSVGAKLYFSYPQQTDAKYTKNNRQDVYLNEIFSQFHYGNEASPLVMGEVGYFKFKYNPDVRNLGEYMFRTGTYPIYFDMGFDFPQARLLGLHIQDNFFNSLKIDLLLSSATIFPTMNWSLSALGSYDIANLHFVTVGAGVDFAHLFDVYTGHSFPVMFGGDPTVPHGNFNDMYIDANGDTSYYTFKGTKIMGRIALDPKVFFPWRYFGQNDLRLYAEADIIGVKNYPDSGIVAGSYDLVAPSYDTLWQRIPIAVGFNFPTFKVLDVLNLELEWFGAKYYNDASGLINQGSKPLPWNVLNTENNPKPIKSKVKWSVYAKKSFCNGHFALTGQVARDHLTLQTADYDNEMYNELLVEWQDWWWALEASWMF
jgi:hypothetical protein